MDDEVDELTEQIVVQLPMGLAEDDLDLRNRLGDAIEAKLAELELGEFDGGDIGSGTMNLFAYVAPEHWQQAFAAVHSIVDEFDLLEVALIARRDTSDEDADLVIVWPEGSDREFSY
ncbi:hypothetical protein Rhe02_96950 [Rhizocola hellebori]|uniref:Uncharacterized protein n=1 Tax=Rhizocola hellebori TaxID=1392758 RepID=A0A8J3QIQ4_9ACTN|nr:hypothetical protein [Rhizocola hellebori]GIH11628.1 hypothetical protein Rhe02_96950 [Rhizocola hellebori]